MAASTGEVSQEEFDVLQAALTALDATVSVLNTAMTTAQSDISDLETDVAALQTTVDALEDEVTAPQPPSDDDTVIDIDIIGIRIQTGVHDLGNSDTITFPQPFKGGTIPFVTTSILKSVASATSAIIAELKSAPTATGVAIQVSTVANILNPITLDTQAGLVYWTAIGQIP